ncbi:uncharacterized protein TRAVEDRAFT_33158 [Trametes versicolor FP-101664 SS1]|uniref:uncharacterized protein n=1 Tax=Trametes versicolor (strain FP-101664) TaxID=717944 RepID=UPI0004622A6E|nr:uncharacterized protein TRAVEDRAFT_33158 [Trametes versicolor FP-101664 SS1]EIW64367.1 hypothetical protein TRAVEDRAFT_33158 [Trametes versicolor FP-101664 SS1]
MGKCDAATSADFKYPENFIPVKGRSWQVYCKVCTPPDHAQGQPMTIAAAIRHERENAKHKTKLAEAALWDPNYQPECDWTTPHVPKGESAWENDYLSERVKAYVNFWMDGIATAARDETPMHMDVFIARYDKQYQEENWQEKYEVWGAEEGEEEEWPVEGFDGEPGHWYEGYTDGYDLTGWDGDQWIHSHTAESLAVFATWWPEDPAPDAGWGFTPEEAAEWEKSRPAEAAAQPSPSSSVTPQQSSEKTASQRSRRRRRNRGRGRGQGKQEGKEAFVPDAATRRVEAHRDRRAKMY